MQKHKFIVEFVGDLSKQEALLFLNDIGSWQGALHPSEYKRFNVNIHSVTQKPLRIIKRD